MHHFALVEIVLAQRRIELTEQPQLLDTLPLYCPRLLAVLSKLPIVLSKVAQPARWFVGSVRLAAAAAAAAAAAEEMSEPWAEICGRTI